MYSLKQNAVVIHSHEVLDWKKDTIPCLSQHIYIFVLHANAPGGIYRHVYECQNKIWIVHQQGVGIT